MNMDQHQFSVQVKVTYLPDESDAENRQFAFAYTITIKNTGQIPAQLIARHWIITDGDEEVEEVKGLGVVGQQPLLRPGEHFEYTSWATLPTPMGTMRGDFFCVSEDAQFFQTPISEFALVMPRTLH